MPTPPRDSNSRVAYTRWEPVSDEADDGQSNNNVPFHYFEEESHPSRFKVRLPKVFSTSHRSSRQRNSNPVPTVSLSTDVVTQRHTDHPRCWSVSIKVLSFMVIFGIGWITGFLVRWGVHTFYIDPMGHCVTPVPYTFDEEFAKYALSKVDHDEISKFFEEFTKDSHHKIGTEESESYAKNIVKNWKEFNLQKVEIDKVLEMVPRPSQVPSEIRVRDENGTVLHSITLPDLNAVYSASGIEEGRLIYGHFGRFKDFHDMSRLFNYNFTNSVVMIKTYRPLYHPASVVRNAQAFGAKAVILFPDPNSYILTKGLQLGILPRNESLSHSVKYVPGDPLSLYVVPSAGEDESPITKPNIPVVSLSYEQALPLLRNYVNSHNLSKEFWYGMPFNTTVMRDFKTSVEVNFNMENVELRNVLGVIPGRYEPTRYVIIGSHHDTWHQGASKPGVGHSVLMEITRVFGEMYSQGWRPGRSLIFASWDGEEIGQLGSTAWLYSHSKELTSRAMTYINLDDLLQGDDNIHVTGSPILRDVIRKAAKLVACPKDDSLLNKTHCILYDEWLEENSEDFEPPFTGYNDNDEYKLTSSGISMFQSIFGISSIELTLKNRHVTQGDAYPYAHSSLDTKANVENFLDTKHAVIAAKFLMAIIMQLVMSAKLSLRAFDYGDSVYVAVQEFLRKNQNLLEHHDVDAQAISNSIEKFIEASQRFHETYTPAPALTLLDHHEFNDQLLELERSFLLPHTSLPLAITKFSQGTQSMQELILSGPYRHVIHGPSLTNFAQMKYLPRLEAALEIAKAESTFENWNSVKRETFFVVDALESASCVLDNHLVYTYFEYSQPPPGPDVTSA